MINNMTCLILGYIQMENLPFFAPVPNIFVRLSDGIEPEEVFHKSFLQQESDF